MFGDLDTLNVERATETHVADRGVLNAAPSAIALSGGGARGAAQVGMLQALRQAGIVPDMVVGASAGAVNGAWYALYPDRLEDLEQVWLGLTRRGVFPGTPVHHAYHLVRHGYVHTMRRWAGTLERYFGGCRLELAEIPLTVCTVRLADGSVVPFQAGPAVPILMASTALPGLFPPQILNGELHVDGGVVEYLPIPTALKLGARTIYALDCSDFPAGDGSRGMTMDRAGQIASTIWVRLVIELAESRGVRVHHLRPSLGDVHDGRDFRQTRRLIQAGRDYVAARLKQAAPESFSP